MYFRSISHAEAASGSPSSSSALLLLLQNSQMQKKPTTGEQVMLSVNKTYLIRFVEQTQAMAHPQRINVIRLAALAELVRLDVLQAHNLLRHDASVPVPADALLS